MHRKKVTAVWSLCRLQLTVHTKCISTYFCCGVYLGGTKISAVIMSDSVWLQRDSKYCRLEGLLQMNNVEMKCLVFIAAFCYKIM